MERKSREELERLLQKLRQHALSPRETYRAVQAFGEMNFQEARPEVERLLTSEDAELRFVALKVLTLYWHIEQHWQTARMALEHDPDEDCRFRAAYALEALRRNTGDRLTLEVLAPVVSNEHEQAVVRLAAYAAMKGVLHFDPREEFTLLKGDLDVAGKVDWAFVNQYLP